MIGNSVIISRSRAGERYANESALFYALKLALQKKGKDCIKKRPDKDGHLTSAPYYIRARDRSWCIHDPGYQIRDAAQRFNRDGELYLRREGTA
jgi:hypothetical protein